MIEIKLIKLQNEVLLFYQGVFLLNRREWCVYIHINRINNKSYIGQAKGDPKRRWGKQGKNYFSSTLFYKAIQKYGWDNFEHIILFDSLTSEEANRIEFLLIELFELRNPLYGYNIREGGKNSAISNITREKLRRANLGKTLSKETKDKISKSMEGENNPFYGKHHNEESIAKMRGSRPSVQNERNPMYGRKHTESTKEKIRQRKIGTKQKQETIKLKSKPVRCIETGIEYSSSREAERQTKINNACISDCCRGKQKTAGGYHWEYVITKEEN